MSERLSIETLPCSKNDLKNGDSSEMLRDVYSGLTSIPKDLSPWPKYFYDERGSELFEKITKQPEYYQTRTELKILRNLSAETLSGYGQLVELGSGFASKTEALLDPMTPSVRYVPLDVSESAVRDSAERLLADYPSLSIQGYVGDFDGVVGEFLSDISDSSGPKLVMFLGGTIGNFTPGRRGEFLRGISSGLSGGDGFLVGLDLVKSPEILEAAYDDSAGVTASFNKNVLSVINYSLGAEFEPGLFSHRAIFDRENSRVEMWLESLEDQKVFIRDLDLNVPFDAGEGVRTELSHKFTRSSIEQMFEDSGLHLSGLYTDDEELFGLALAELASNNA